MTTRRAPRPGTEPAAEDAAPTAPARRRISAPPAPEPAPTAPHIARRGRGAVRRQPATPGRPPCGAPTAGKTAHLASLAIAQEAFEAASAELELWRTGARVAIPIQPETYAHRPRGGGRPGAGMAPRAASPGEEARTVRPPAQPPQRARLPDQRSLIGDSPTPTDSAGRPPPDSARRACAARCSRGSRPSGVRSPGPRRSRDRSGPRPAVAARPARAS